MGGYLAVHSLHQHQLATIRSAVTYCTNIALARTLVNLVVLLMALPMIGWPGISEGRGVLGSSLCCLRLVGDCAGVKLGNFVAD